MNVSELIGRPVLEISTATTVGRVDDVVVDVSGRRLHGVRIAKSSAAGDWLAWDQIKAIGTDAVTIEGVSQITSPGELPGPWLRGDKALGGRVLTDGGRELGALTDVDIDAESGRVVAILVGDRSLDAESLLGIGSYAAVVREPKR